MKLTRNGQAQQIKARRFAFDMDSREGQINFLEAAGRVGMTNNEIADAFQVSKRKMKEILDTDDEYWMALDKGRKFTNSLVEQALLKRALGYTVEEREVTRERMRDSNGDLTAEYKLVTTKIKERHIMPDVAAAKFWLEHREAKRWPVKPPAVVSVENAQMQIQSVANLIQNPVKGRRGDDK